MQEKAQTERSQRTRPPVYAPTRVHAPDHARTRSFQIQPSPCAHARAHERLSRLSHQNPCEYARASTRA
eukprot:2041606-Pleurochrysis_carterae.AAC.2